jgi:hypothetical protein
LDQGLLKLKTENAGFIFPTIDVSFAQSIENAFRMAFYP